MTVRPTAAAVMIAALLAAPQATAQTREVSGTLTYLPRVALPAQAKIVLEALGPDGSPLAAATTPTDGRQVPLPFALTVPAGGPAELRAAIMAEGRALWIAAAAPLPDDVDDLGEIRLGPFEPMVFTSAFRCGGRLVEIGLVDGRAVIEAGNGRRVLEPVRAASGARYEAAGDADTWFWNRGDAAMISIDGETERECRLAPPRARLPWEARGQEPGWNLRLGDGRMALVSAYGAERTGAPLPEPSLDGTAFVYEAENGGPRAVISDALCRDAATGMPHPETVRVETGGGTLHGCGGAPADLLTGREWRVEEISGDGALDDSEVTLVFDGEGGVAGSAGCNRYRAAFEIGGEGVSVGPAAATLRACPEPLMRQERRFLDALAEAARFDFAQDGALLILGPGDGPPTLRARRP